MAGSFVLQKSQDQKFYFNLRAENEEKILTSEMYNAKPGALNGIESVKKNAGDDSRFQRRQSKAGKPYFVLVAANNEIIGTSEEYSSPEAMENGIAAVKRVASGSAMKDLA
jgi:hypothetical protein